MKTQALTSGLRITLSKTELQTLLALAEHSAADNRCYLSNRQQIIAADLVRQLRAGLSEVRWKQAEAKARHEVPKREAERRAAREHHAEIDGYTVMGMLGDWTDLSDDPDRRQWADMFHPDIRPREQGEIRRNVWRIYVCRGSAASDEFMVLPADCTMTADRAEIPALVRRIIANGRT